jgi:hypothetical protein
MLEEYGARESHGRSEIRFILRGGRKHIYLRFPGLKWILEREDGVIWTGLIRLRIGING